MSTRATTALVLLACVVAVIAALLAPATGPEGMSVLEAAVLGAVEGLTEYLPVSSTGHLLVVQRALGIGTADAAAKEAADAFAICIQLGAILAVLGLYAGRVRQVGRGLLGRDAAGARLGVNLIAGFVPAAIIGLLVGDRIKEHLFAPWPIVAAWAVGGAAILVVARVKHEETPEGRSGLGLGELTWKLALLIGLAQCIAMWPGVSRSLITIVGGVLVGLSLAAAVEFSFLLGVVTLTAATAYDALQHGSALTDAYSSASLIVGLCVAFASALLAVRWMVSYLQRHGLHVFGWYRLAVAALVGGLLLAGWL
ncbi:MAG: undecaprenyl-diphosphate phosphatase [Planctomycetota bacterium]|nr:undecaprenyl-diphosphate phosphatase [Planctomycetota bacterium]